MKVGDKVRFLNAVGGGIVRRFQGKDLVIVEEEDGFETPVLIRECVVVGDNSSQITQSSQKAIEKIVIPQPEKQTRKEEKSEIVEISGGDRLNIYLAFLPMEIKNLGKTDFETYLINDSNYFLFLNFMSRKNNAWISRHTELIEPNTRIFIEELPKSQIGELEKVCIQFIAFKQDKPFGLKNAYSVELRIDALKFFKLHSFRENDFFEDEALIYPVVTNDTPARELLISATEIQEAMTQKIKTDKPHRIPSPAKKEKTPILEVDLHINQLLDNTNGLNNADMLNVQLDKFREVMEENKNKKGQKIVFIHGKGEGVLRNAVLNELRMKYKNFPVQDASFKEYGFGATMVTIK
ncbi:DUF2027 domain-containing protein [Bacteroidales bacterium OttesenSCG-928-M06]|nr:DUF2027 domain-containing protein [Bacteroidales bacterium OttesenSCG-928-M06]